jgi:hypothetical protein
MIQLQRFQVWSWSTGAQEMSSSAFAFVIANLEMEGTPSLDMGYDDLKYGVNFFLVECDPWGVVLDRDGINEDVK